MKEVIMNLIISIRPKYINEMRKNIKKYEFRKNIFKKKVDKIFIYSTNPVKKIVGYVNYSYFFEGKPEDIWEKTKEHAGISKDKYMEYFDHKKKAFAIDFSDIYFFENPINPYEEIKNFRAPQSFMYFEGEFK